jgi:hypothetical protein
MRSALRELDTVLGAHGGVYPRRPVTLRVDGDKCIGCGMTHPNSFGSRASLSVGSPSYTYFRLGALDALAGNTVASLPFSLKSCSRTCCAARTAPS